MAGQEGVQPEYLCDGKSVHRTDDSRIASVASDHAGEPRVDAIRDAASRCQVAAEVNERFLELLVPRSDTGRRRAERFQQKRSEHGREDGKRDH